MNLQNSGATCRENADVRHHPRRRMIQYSEEPVIDPRTRGVLDTPPSRSMTAVGGEWRIVISVIASEAKQSRAAKEDWIASSLRSSQ
jgi:hypothetical protein